MRKGHCVCKEAGSLAGLHFHFDLVLSLPELRSLAGGAPPGGPALPLSFPGVPLSGVARRRGLGSAALFPLHPPPQPRGTLTGLLCHLHLPFGPIRSPAALLGARLLQPVSTVTGKTGHKVPRCCGQSSSGTALLQHDCPRQFSTEFCPACWTLP